MNTKFAKILVVSGSLMPFLAFAQFDIQTNLIEPLRTAVDSLVPLLMTLALVAFIWGLVQFIFSAGDEAKRKSGKGIMIWGVIALFVMASVWGLTSAIGGALGLDSGDAPSASDLTPTE